MDKKLEKNIYINHSSGTIKKLYHINKRSAYTSLYNLCLATEQHKLSSYSSIQREDFIDKMDTELTKTLIADWDEE